MPTNMEDYFEYLAEPRRMLALKMLHIDHRHPPIYQEVKITINSEHEHTVRQFHFRAGLQVGLVIGIILGFVLGAGAGFTIIAFKLYG